MTSASASARMLDFTITNVVGANFGNCSFSLDDARAPNIVLNDSVRYSMPAVPVTFSNVPSVGSGMINTGVTFFAPIQQGGLQIGFLPFGTFVISTIPQNNGLRPFDNHRITIAAAVPEPTTWALMLIEFGAIGYSLRRRKIRFDAVQAV